MEGNLNFGNEFLPLTLFAATVYDPKKYALGKAALLRGLGACSRRRNAARALGAALFVAASFTRRAAYTVATLLHRLAADPASG